MESNSTVQRLLYLSSFAAGSFLFKSLLDQYATVPLDFFYSSIEVYSHDEAYDYLLYWLIKQQFDESKNRLIASTSLSTGQPEWYSDRHTDDVLDEPAESGDEFRNTPKLLWTPSTGTHYFKYQGRYLSLTREVEEQNMQMYTRTEKLRISCLGWNPSILKQLMVEARVRFSQKEKGKTVIYNGIKGPYGDELYWSRITSRPARPLSTVFLEEEHKSAFLRDVQQYLHPSTMKWYSDRGIPYRRGYLFYGPPGTGKSSLAFAAAGFLGLNIYMISLNSRQLTEDGLSQLFQSLPHKCLVLLEDVDSNGVTDQRTTDNEDKQNGKNNLSLSALLNIIDGVAAQEGRVLIMTTNHLDRLDAALVRPGRVDYHIEFKLANRLLSMMMFDNFFGSPPESEESSDPVPDKEEGSGAPEFTEMAIAFADKIPEDTFSPAEIQGFLLENKTSADDAVSHVEAWVKGRLEAMEKEAEEKKKLEEKQKLEEKKEAEKKESEKTKKSEGKKESDKKKDEKQDEAQDDSSEKSSEPKDGEGDTEQTDKQHQDKTNGVTSTEKEKGPRSEESDQDKEEVSDNDTDKS